MPGSLYERGDDGNVYNTAIAVSPLGEIAATYRKVFPWQPYEQTTPGHEFVVFDIPGVGRIGLAICYDGSFPETARQLAWLGAEVIIQPTLTTTRDREMELVCARANAWTQPGLRRQRERRPIPRASARVASSTPRARCANRPATGEEVLIDCLDLDAVTRARTHGTFGLNRPWDQLARHGADVRLPMYGGGMKTPPWHGADQAGAGPSAAHQLAGPRRRSARRSRRSPRRRRRRNVTVGGLVEATSARRQVAHDDGLVQRHRGSGR